MVAGSNPAEDVPLFKMLKKIELVMEWWLAHTPNWMQPTLFWTAYYKALDTFFIGQRR